MEYAIQAVHSTYYEAHPVTSKPLTASAQYSQEQCKKRILHSELAKIGESVRGEHLILR